MPTKPLPARVTIRSRIIAPALSLVREAGGNADALLDRFDLSPLAEAEEEVTLPLSALPAFLDAAAEAANDPFLGVRIAARFQRGSYGLTEFASRTAATLGEAFSRLERYISLVDDIVAITFTVDRGRATIEHRASGVSDGFGRHVNEFFVTMLLSEARKVCSRPVLAERAYFAHRAPHDRSQLESMLRCPIDFGASANGLVLPAESVSSPLLSADPPLSRLLERFAEREMAQRAVPRAFLDLVRSAMRDAFRLAAPTLATTAAAFGMSPRSFQRRLADDGVTFNQLLDQVREDLARHALAHGEPLAAIAADLGYADLRTFLRAFKRWTGMTPTQFKRAILNG